MKILVVDDEKLIRDVIVSYASVNNFQTDEAKDGNEAIDLVKNNNYDIIIMDIMMPHLDGFSAIKEIKKVKNIPVLVLSARKEEYDKLLGFEIGIDDYMTKPFSPKELIARIKAITKRNNLNNKTYIYKDLIIDISSRKVTINDKEIILTPKEFDLLKYLVENENIALNREQILEHIWGYDFYGDDRTIDTHIKTLRNNLGKYKKYIKTVRSIGYKFEYDEK